MFLLSSAATNGGGFGSARPGRQPRLGPRVLPFPFAFGARQPQGSVASGLLELQQFLRLLGPGQSPVRLALGERHELLELAGRKPSPR